MTRRLLPLIFIVFPVMLFAQSSFRKTSKNEFIQSLEKEKRGEGIIQVYQDGRIEDLLNRHLSMRKKARGKIDGFRIQIAMGEDRDEIAQSKKTMARFIGSFPEIKAYEEYTGLYYRVRVGDFRTRYDAFRHWKIVTRQFPDAYIVPDQVNYPELETKEVNRDL